MRDLDACKAEVFRRAGEQKAARARTRRRVLKIAPLCLVILIAVAALPALLPLSEAGASGGAAPEGQPMEGSSMDKAAELDGFSFSLTWGAFGNSSYDSASGKLVKTTHATHPEDYVTTYWLTEAQKAEIYQLIRQLDVTAYPDHYEPQGLSFPSTTLILSVHTNQIQKTITARDLFPSGDDSGSPSWSKFYDACYAIVDILTGTDAWKALPDYEFYYE